VNAEKLLKSRSWLSLMGQRCYRVLPSLSSRFSKKSCPFVFRWRNSPFRA